MKNQYAVWGNPIAQSRSPEIQQQFAKQCGITLDYTRQLGDEVHFEQQLAYFFEHGGQGCNITAPFKARAFAFADQHSQRCELAQASNTLKKLPDGQIYADNTDGAGLVSDLNRLGLLNQGQEILMLGAGGAAQGVLLPLLQAGASITLANRTLSTAQRLLERFSPFGTIVACALEAIPAKRYALVINATSLGLQGKVVAIAPNVMQNCAAAYDMQYSKGEPTPFLVFAQKCGVAVCVDGFGMLVGQAAHSFHLWFDQMPDISALLMTEAKK
ncbi:shikimate dehydrogenase [Pasteurellaceae bacterium HPA106]|uniref:shikimate dehydrogenase n=1 Tax=Spirabiliibacterium pneumoniae TaxID=221400 RepID=UPI001AADBE4F|nr:shikimate dehydrogenase [Spirabiliibacterium pneumoniae]MBE2897011.1 shikimate dehydrogenase [Spirabiliibacterium pneumoniae]